MSDATNADRPALYTVGQAVVATSGRSTFHGTVVAVAEDKRQRSYAYTLAVTDGPFTTIRVYERDLRPDPTKEARRE